MAMAGCIPVWALTIILLMLPCFSSALEASQQIHSVLHDGREIIQLSDSDAMDGVLWAVQLSDIHVSSFYPDRAASLQSIMGPLLSLIRPALVLITGDLTDAKSKDIASRRQDEAEWIEYREAITRVIEKSGLPSYAFYDLRGNHDKFGVPEVGGDLDYFRKYSVNSLRNRSSTVQSVTLMNRDWKHLFVGVDTSMEIGLRGPCNLFGHPTDNQLEEVDRELSQWDNQASDKVSKVAFGHFPMSFTASTTTRNRLESIFAKHSISSYVCGHLHKNFGPNLIKHHFHPHAKSKATSGLEDGEFWEWEMGDWRMCRMMRIIVIDHGQVSYVDFDLSNLSLSSSETEEWLPTLIVPTYPLDSGKMERIRSHHDSEEIKDTIRALIISPRPIKSVLVRTFRATGNVFIFIEETEMHLLSRTGEAAHLYSSKLNSTNYAHNKNYVFQVCVLDSAGTETDSSLRQFSPSRRLNELNKTWREYFVIGFVWEEAFVTLTCLIFTCLLSALIFPKIIFHYLVSKGVYTAWVFSMFKNGNRKLDARKAFNILIWFFVQSSTSSAVWWGQLLVLLWLMFLPWLWGQVLAEGYPLGYMSIWGWTVSLNERMPQQSGLGWPDLMTVVLPYLFLVILPLYFLLFALSAEASLRQLTDIDCPATYKKNEKIDQSSSEDRALIEQNEESNGNKSEDLRSVPKDKVSGYMKWTRTVLLVFCVLLSFVHMSQVCALAGAYGTASFFASPGFAWPVPILMVVAVANSSTCRKGK